MAGWECQSCGGDNPEGTPFCGHCGGKAPDAPSPEERRLVTALFADISGFTPLADRLDPEELLEVIDPIVSALSTVIGRFEGYVEKFAGDALLALFGAPVSHDDDAERALRVALELHAELERMKPLLSADAAGLTLHVGVNSGHGIARIIGSEARTDYAVLGDAVILAQRLESAAPPGETYVSDSTVRLAEHAFEFEPVGELTLKGKSEPVPAWRLVRERPAAGRPQRARMVGRARELALLERAFADGGAVTVTGEAGVGKSRLLKEARAAVEQRGLRWLGARCLSYGAALPYWPFADLLRRLDEPDVASNPFFARLLGAAAPAGVAIDPEAFRRGLHAAFPDWLRSLGGAVLVIEDAHWLDAASQALVAELGLVGEPHLLLLTARPEGEARLEDALPERARIELAPLDERGVEELLESQLGAPPPHGLAAFIGGRTGGNPFFVQELARSLQESGALVREQGRWEMRPGWDARSLPPTIEALLAGRMDALSRAAATTLQTASVIGRRVPEPLLRAVGGDAVEADELVAAGFLDEEQDEGTRVLVFHHALVQDVAYERLLRKQRRELHREVARAAEELYGAGDDTVGLLARHLYLGGGGPKAVEYLLRAGSRARLLYANREAILHLGRCAELVPGDGELRLGLADLHELVGDYDEALALYEQLRDASGELRAWLGLTRVQRLRGDYLAALAVVDDAFATQELRGLDLSGLWLEAGRSLSVSGYLEQAVDVLSCGLASASVGGSRGLLLLQLARAESLVGELAAAAEHAAEAVETFEERGDARNAARALRVLGDIRRSLGRLDEAELALRRGLELAQRVGSVEEIGGCLMNLGLVELEQGRLDEALATQLAAVEEFERVRNGAGRVSGYGNVAWILMHRDEHEQALAYCERALELGRAIGHTAAVAETYDTMARISLRRGAYVDAGEQAEQAVEILLGMGAERRAAEILELAADAWTRADDPERARTASARARSVVEPVQS